MMKEFPTKELEIIKSFPCLYLPKIQTLVIADLHLGYEGIMAEKGMLLPKVQFNKIIGIMKQILSQKKAPTLIINGDIKHEFSETSYHEFKEVKDFLEFSTSQFDRVLLIRGNHDTFIQRVTRRYGVEVRDKLEIGKYLFAHGHKEFDLEDKSEVIVIGHEHPSLALFDEVGAKEKIKCFLWGKTLEGKEIIVMPALSYFAYGSDINLLSKNDLLSPILRNEVQVDELLPVGIIEGEKCLKFPKIGKLRIIQRGFDRCKKVG
jgi:hypothetical protein